MREKSEVKGLSGVHCASGNGLRSEGLSVVHGDRGKGLRSEEKVRCMRSSV